MMSGTRTMSGTWTVMYGIWTVMSRTWTVMSEMWTVMSGIWTENISDVYIMDSFDCPSSRHR